MGMLRSSVLGVHPATGEASAGEKHVTISFTKMKRTIIGTIPEALQAYIQIQG